MLRCLLLDFAAMSFARNTSPAASSYTMAPDEPYCPYNEFDIALFKQPYNAELRTTSERVAAARSGSARAPLVDGTPSSCSSDAEWAGNYHSKPLENGVALDERNDGACKACREQHTKCVRGPDGKCDACSRRGMSCNPAAPRKKGRAPDM